MYINIHICVYINICMYILSNSGFYFFFLISWCPYFAGLLGRGLVCPLSDSSSITDVVHSSEDQCLRNQASTLGKCPSLSVISVMPTPNLTALSGPWGQQKPFWPATM